MSSPHLATTRNWSLAKVSERPADDRALFSRLAPVALLGLLLFGPVAFGAVDEWAILVLRASAGIFFCLWCWQQSAAKEIAAVPNPLYFPIALFGLLVMAQIVFHISKFLYATVDEALNYVAYGLLFFLAAQLFQHRNDLRKLAISFTIFGFTFSLFAIMQSLSGTHKLYWLRQPSSINSAIFGSYVNHNHYAGLMELLLPFPLLLSLGGVWRGPKRILCAFAAVLMCASLFLSHSRGGMVSFVAQLILVALIAIRRHSKRTALFLGLACLVLVGLLLWLDTSGMVRERVTTLANPLEASGTRITILKDGLRMFREHPLIGWGLETFPTVYPPFRTFSTDLFVNEAHNDYLQVLVETGIVGFLLALWFIVQLYRSGLSYRRSWSHDLKAVVRMASLVGCTGILVHSFFDFNLRVPANAALFFVLAALATSGQPSLRNTSENALGPLQ